jgi:hypothetical protein
MMKTTKPLLAAAAMTLLLVAVPAAADAKTYIGGPIAPGAFEVFRWERPKKLVLGPINGSLVEIMRLQRIRWAHWGRRTATATARTRTKTYDPWTRVKVRAFRRRTCEAEPRFRLYTRVQTTTEYGSRKWKTPSCSVVTGYMD